ncbi:MAG: TraB/GumN family protein [Acidobacteria bacterium]|nr:TraB/GumN family protein [Acidobacteriota bacterium]
MANEPTFAPEDYQVLETLHQGDRTIYVLGTAHVSRKSVEDVERLIQAVKPDTVCVELCPTRYEALVDESRWRKLDVFQVIKQGKTLMLMANLALASFQRSLGDQLGVLPGSELKSAVATAKEVGAEVALVDRDVQITLKRAWANVPFLKRVTVLMGLLESVWVDSEITEEDLEKLKQRDQLSVMMEEFSNQLPEIKTPLIDERDAYLMSKIEEAPGKTVVAVVGAGHVDGMLSYFGKPVDRTSIEVIPPPKQWTKLLKWIIPAIVMAAFYYGWQQHQGESFQNMLTAWILPNSVMAAFLTAVAGGRLLSILTAFIASPITSLNPTLGAGMVVGLVEAWLRKPTVADMERVHDDIRSVKGVYRNSFTRVLLVTVLSTIGSALGALVGLSWLINILARTS